MKQATILLSGGSGYVGGRFLERLSERSSIRVNTVGRSTSDDIHWDELVLDDLNGIDVVYHLAGSTDLWSVRSDTSYHYSANVYTTQRLYSLFLESDAKMFVYMSTAKVMGEGRLHPYKMDEIPCPETVYAESKWEAEMIIQRMWSDFRSSQPQSAKSTVILRPTMIFGGQRMGTLWSLWRWIDRGLPLLDSWLVVRRSMVHVDSVLDVLEEIPSKSDLLACYFLTDNPTLTLGEICETMAVGSKTRIKKWRLAGVLWWGLLKLDKVFLDGKIAWHLGKLEKNFIVEPEGLFLLRDQSSVGLSRKRLTECIEDFKERSE